MQTLVTCCCLLAFYAGTASAGMVGGDLWQADVDPTSFADSVVPWDLSGGGFFAGPPESLLDADLLDGWLYLAPGDAAAMGFSDNLAVNGEGDDIAVFEWGVPEPAAVQAADPGSPDGWSDALWMDSYPTGVPLLNVLLVDLADLGLADGATVDAIRIEGVGAGYLELSGAAALHNLPLGGGSLLEFFDRAVAAGLLAGMGQGMSAPHRRDALRSMIAAGALRAAVDRVDGSPNPPDFAAGPAAPVLADRLRDAIRVPVRP